MTTNAVPTHRKTPRIFDENQAGMERLGAPVTVRALESAHDELNRLFFELDFVPRAYGDPTPYMTATAYSVREHMPRREEVMIDYGGLWALYDDTNAERVGPLSLKPEQLEEQLSRTNGYGRVMTLVIRNGKTENEHLVKQVTQLLAKREIALNHARVSAIPKASGRFFEDDVVFVLTADSDASDPKEKRTLKAAQTLPTPGPRPTEGVDELLLIS